MTGFNKREFARFIAARFNVPQDEGLLLFDEIGQRMDESLSSGDTVFVFGKGTLKVVRRRSASDTTRIRFRPSKREAEKGMAVTLHGLAGIAGGILENVVVISSVSAGERALRIDRPCMASGCGGNLTIYKGDDGQYRCLISRPGAAAEESVFPTKNATKLWLKAAFERMTRA